MMKVLKHNNINKRSLIITITLLFIFTSVQAQNNKRIASDDVSVSGFGVIYTNISQIGGKKANYIGGGGAILVKNRIFIGAFGSGLLSQPTISTGVYINNTMELSYMGLWLGHIFLRNKRIRPILSAKAAIGGISLFANTLPVYDFYDNISTFIPILEIEYQLTKYISISIGGQYSYLIGVDDLDGYTNEDFQNAGIYISFKVG